MLKKPSSLKNESEFRLKDRKWAELGPKDCKSTENNLNELVWLS